MRHELIEDLFNVGIPLKRLENVEINEDRKQVLFKERDDFYYVKNNFRTELSAVLMGWEIRWDGYMVTDYEKYL